MEKYKKITKITTWMNLAVIIICLASSVFLVIISGVLGDYVPGLLDMITDVNSQSVTAGYEVLGGVFGLFGVGFFAFAMIALTIALILVAGWLAVPTISGFNLIKQIKASYFLDEVAKSVKRDAILKIVMNGIPAALLLFGSISSKNIDMFSIVVGGYFGVIAGLSAYELNVLDKDANPYGM